MRFSGNSPQKWKTQTTPKKTFGDCLAWYIPVQFLQVFNFIGFVPATVAGTGVTSMKHAYDNESKVVHISKAVEDQDYRCPDGKRLIPVRRNGVWDHFRHKTEYPCPCMTRLHRHRGRRFSRRR